MPAADPAKTAEHEKALKEYMEKNVQPHLTEALIEICKVMPDDPVEYLAQTMFEKADEIDAAAAAKKKEEGK